MGNSRPMASSRLVGSENDRQTVRNDIIGVILVRGKAKKRFAAKNSPNTQINVITFVVEILKAFKRPPMNTHSAKPSATEKDQDRGGVW